MSENVAEYVVACLVIYAVVGVVFALFFVIAGARWVDSNAAGMPLRARATIFPGAAGLWPLLLIMIVTSRSSA